MRQAAAIGLLALASLAGPPATASAQDVCAPGYPGRDERLCRAIDEADAAERRPSPLAHLSCEQLASLPPREMAKLPSTDLVRIIECGGTTSEDARANARLMDYLQWLRYCSVTGGCVVESR
jgi:hypothetical protein